MALDHLTVLENYQPMQGGITPIDSIVTGATAGQNLDQAHFDHWPRCFLGLWPLTELNFNHWMLTTHTFMEVYGRMRSNSTPSLVYRLTMQEYSLDRWLHVHFVLWPIIYGRKRSNLPSIDCEFLVLYTSGYWYSVI